MILTCFLFSLEDISYPKVDEHEPNIEDILTMFPIGILMSASNTTKVVSRKHSGLNIPYVVYFLLQIVKTLFRYFISYNFLYERNHLTFSYQHIHDSSH